MMTLCDPPESQGSSKLPVEADRPEGVPPLRSFYLYLTTCCNLKCRHCWVNPVYEGEVLKPDSYIDQADLGEAVKEGKTLGLSSVKLTGGEPTLHPHFREIVTFLTKEGLSLNMETNGTLVTSELAWFLKDESNVAFISVSIDSPDPAGHDRFRGVKGAYERALSGLDNLVGAGYKNCQVIMTVHHGNRHQMAELVELAADHGAGSVKFNHVTPTGRGANMHEKGEALSFSEYLEMVEYINKELRPNSGIPVILLMPPALTPIEELPRTDGQCDDCGVAGVLGIMGNGDIALCGIGQTVPELTYGRLGVDSIREIWLHHPVIQGLRRDLRDVEGYPGICGSCIHAKSCHTGCVANNYVLNGSLVSPQWLCREAEMAGVFPKTRMRSYTMG